MKTCERELGEEDEEKTGEVVVFPWYLLQLRWAQLTWNLFAKTSVCSAEGYRCSIHPSASIVRNISIHLLQAHFCRGLSWVFMLLNKFVIKRYFLLQNLQALTSRKHKSITLHAAVDVVLESVINSKESKKGICTSVTKLRQETLMFLPYFTDDGRSTVQAGLRPSVSVYNFQGHR